MVTLNVVPLVPPPCVMTWVQKVTIEYRDFKVTCPAISVVSAKKPVALKTASWQLPGMVARAWGTSKVQKYPFENF